MDREQLKNIPIGYPWAMDDMRRVFGAVWGGVAYPGKRPGFAVVAGLCHPQQRDFYEVHVLDEVESQDLGELLRRCSGMAARYRIEGLTVSTPFQWIGDHKSTAGQTLVSEINRETRPSSPRDRLVINCSTPIRDMERPYLYMTSKLRECLEEDHKQLYLHGSRAAHYLTDLPPEDIRDLTFGEYPAVEALAFVVVALREHGERILRDRIQPSPPAKSIDIFNRNRFYGHRRTGI